MRTKNWQEIRKLAVSVSCALLFASAARAQNRESHVSSASTTLDAETRARAAWDSNAFYQIHKQRSYENLVLLSVVTHAYHNNPKLDSDDMVKTLNKLHAQYQAKYEDASGQYHVPTSAVEATQSLLNLAGAYGGKYAKAAKPLADEVLKWGVKGYEYYQQGPKQLEAQKFLSDTINYTELLGRSVDEAYLLAEQNPNAKKVIATYFGVLFNADPGDSAEVIRTKNTDFKLSGDLDTLLESNEDSKIDIERLTAIVLKQNQKLTEDIGEVREECQKLLTAQSEHLASQSAEEPSSSAVKALEKRSYQLNIEGAKSSVYLLSTLATLLHNPSLAHTITVTGNSSIQIIDSFQKYNAAIEESQTTLNKVASSVTLAADWLSAGLSLISLLQPGGSSDEIIAAELNAIRQQLAQMRQEMHERFDEVDMKLDRLFASMDEQFAIVTQILNAHSGKLNEILAAANYLDQRLYELDWGLTSLEIRLDEQIQAGFDREVDRELRRCFSSSQAVNRAKFEGCLDDFVFQSTDIRLDPLRLAPIDDESILKYSQVKFLAENYVYMSRIGSQRLADPNMKRIEDSIANPPSWSAAVDGYLALTQARPEYAGYVRPDHLKRDAAGRGNPTKHGNREPQRIALRSASRQLPTES